MKAVRWLALLPLLVLAPRAEAGGPELVARACTVHEVQVSDDKIVLVVSGRCAICVTDPDKEKGRCKFVDTTMDRCVITVPRPKIPNAGFKSWAEQQAVAKSLAGKTAWIQLLGTITIKRTTVVAVDCTDIQYGDAAAKPGGKEQLLREVKPIPGPATPGERPVLTGRVKPTHHGRRTPAPRP